MKKSKYSHIAIILFLIAGMMMINACSNKKNTFTRRVFHNLTAHYNVYFNGKEALLAAERELENSVSDNYMKILPVYKLGDKQQSDALKPYLDRAIEKGAKVINRHSMEFNRVEHVRWVDNSYLLMGKANFYKKDYIAAKRNFDFVIKKYDAPEKYTAMLWLAKTLIHKEEYEKGQTLLDQLKSKIGGDEKIDKKTIIDLPQAYADMYILQGKYSQAIDPLKQAIELEKNKQRKTRLMFILAQIYQHEKIDFQATEYYTKVIKRNPDYEMAFNANINLATAFDVKTGDAKLVTKELNKLLKDVKNKDYKDQIYYALAQVANKEGNDTLTRAHLKNSCKYSISNDYQKAISALQLAEIYYAEADYLNAQIYYDTTMQFLPFDYKNYDHYEKTNYILTDLANHITTVKTEDSLQYLANLPEAERKKIIDDLVNKAREEKKRQEELERERRESMAFMQQNRRTSPRKSAGSGGGANWYFYNSSAMSFGYTEFMKKWGRRKLEDLWRLSDKRMQDFNFGDEDDLALEGNVDTTNQSTDPLSPKTYMQNIPLSKEKMERSNKRIAKSLYKLGFLYKEELKSNEKAIESFESFVSRFPENQKTPSSYYQLYLLYQAKSDQANVNKYSEILTGNYPESDYAKLILDPKYLEELMQEQDRVNRLYHDTYLAYEEEQYFSAILYAEEAIGAYPKSPMLPHFEYIKALSRGKSDGEDTLVDQLRKFVRKYPVSDLTPMAREVLNRFNVKAELSDEEKIQMEKQRQIDEAMDAFSYTPQASHYYVMVIPAGKININATKVRFADHNIKNYRLIDLKVNSLLLDKNYELITVSGFGSKDKAMDYFKDMQNNNYVFANISPDSFRHFVISNNNYPVFYQKKDVEMYLRFFRSEYLKEDL